MQTPMVAGSSSMMDRIMGVITLKAPVYRAIADDTTGTSQALIVVIIATIIRGFFDTLGNTGRVVPAIGGAIAGLIVGLIAWAVAAWVLAFVAKALNGKTNTMEMLRVTGYVQVFDLIAILNVLSLGGAALRVIVGLISFVVVILHLIGYVIGVREAAEFSTGNAVITAIIAAIVQAVLYAIIFAFIFGIIAVIFGLAAVTGAQ
jgi:hypothetical protein